MNKMQYNTHPYNRNSVFWRVYKVTQYGENIQIVTSENVAFGHVRPAKIQVWSESSLSAFWIAILDSFFMRTMKTLIRLRGCAGWFEYSSSAHVKGRFSYVTAIKAAWIVKMIVAPLRFSICDFEINWHSQSICIHLIFRFIFFSYIFSTGFYPVHFHMCQDISGKEAILKANSIHNSYARAVTVHGTWGNDSSDDYAVQVIVQCLRPK